MKLEMTMIAVCVRTIFSLLVMLSICSLSGCSAPASNNDHLEEQSFLSLIRNKSDSLQWLDPLELSYDWKWNWDSVYFVQWHESDLNIPIGSREIIDSDEYAEDHTYVFFTENGTINKYLRIPNWMGKFDLVPCSNHKRGFGVNQKYYFVKCGNPPEKWIGIYPSECDSSIVFKYVYRK
jgi:hypothetical protein